MQRIATLLLAQPLSGIAHAAEPAAGSEKARSVLCTTGLIGVFVVLRSSSVAGFTSAEITLSWYPFERVSYLFRATSRAAWPLMAAPAES